MSLLRWDPFADMAQLRDQVDRLFQQSLTRSGHEHAAMQVWSPAVDIYETKDAIELRMDISGVKADDIDIQVTADTLTIKGERKADPKVEGRQVVRLERSYGPFQRSFTLGVPVEQQGISASYRDGVLELILPKREEVKPKQVKVDIQSTPQEIEGK